jgi:hypothetical protein
MVPATNACFQPVAWWYTRKKIGRGLAQHYELANNLPPQLLVLIRVLDGESAISIHDSSTDRLHAQAQSVFRTQRLTESALYWHCNEPPWQR